jgi:hypothetical protein
MFPRKKQDSNPRLVVPTPVFKTGALNHSAIFPVLQPVFQIPVTKSCVSNPFLGRRVEADGPIWADREREKREKRDSNPQPPA